MMEVLLVDVEG